MGIWSTSMTHLAGERTHQRCAHQHRRCGEMLSVWQTNVCSQKSTPTCVYLMATEVMSRATLYCIFAKRKGKLRELQLKQWSTWGKRIQAVRLLYLLKLEQRKQRTWNRKCCSLSALCPTSSIRTEKVNLVYLSNPGSRNRVHLFSQLDSASYHHR